MEGELLGHLDEVCDKVGMPLYAIKGLPSITRGITGNEKIAVYRGIKKSSIPYFLV